MQATEKKSPGSKLARAEFISYSKAVQLSYLCEASSSSAKGRGWSVVRVSCSVEKAEWAEQKRLYLNRNQKFQKQRTSGHCESGARLITSPNSFSTTNTLRNNSGDAIFRRSSQCEFFSVCVGLMGTTAPSLKFQYNFSHFAIPQRQRLLMEIKML